MKNLTLAGRLTRDAETRDAGADRVTGFSVAVDDRAGRDKTTLYFDCSMWGKRGEAVAPYLKKGTPVTVSGDLSKREHEGKTYLTVRVNDLTLQGGKQAETGGGGGDDGFSGRAGSQSPKESYDLDDAVPF